MRAASPFRGRRRNPRARGAGALAAFFVAVPVAAQQGAGDLPGPELTLDFTTGVEASDNIDLEREPAGTSTISTTRIGLGYLTRTRSQSLRISGGATLEFGAYADEEVADPGLQSPFLSLAYTRQSRSAELSLTALYSETDIGRERIDLVDLGADGDPDDLIVDQGRRATTRLGVELLLGRGGPVTYGVAFGYTDDRYTDADDPDLNDRTRLSFDQSLGLALSPTTRLVFDLEYSERDENDDEDTFETNVSALVGITQELRSGLTASARFGYSVEEITRTQAGVRDTERDDAPILRFEVAQARPNGSVTAALSRSLDEQGPRSVLTFGRALELPRSSLDATLGITVAENDDQVRFVGRIAYERPLPRGAFSVNLSQEVTSDEDGEYLSTSADVGYRHDLTRLSQISLDLGLAASDALDPDEIDRQRARISLAYSYRLTEDWTFNAGIRHFTSRESDRDPIIENAVFANLSRQFDLLP